MSVESRLARTATIRTAMVIASGVSVFIAREVLKRREANKNLEYMEQAVGDYGFPFQKKTKLG